MTSQIWADQSVNLECAKSYASTTDDYSPYNYFQHSVIDFHTYYYQKYDQLEDGIFTIVPQLILNDLRTTLMIRNIPYDFNIETLAYEVDY
jgi:hypothetical protein